MKLKAISLKIIISFLVSLGMNMQNSVLATTYYVNDAVLNGNDSYTTAIGAAGNNGLSPSTPKLSVVVVAGLVVPGDIVYIDGGTFTGDFAFSNLTGTAGSPIQFIGNGTTKTIIQGVAGGNAWTIRLDNSKYMTFDKMKVISAAGEWAFQIYRDSDNNTISNCETDADQYAVDILRYNGAGSPDLSPDNNLVTNCLLNSKYVGVRIKSDNLDGSWATSATNGPISNIIRDNIVNVNGATVYASMELQATRTNTIIRNKFSSTGNTDVGTMALIHFCANQIIENNYVVNHTPIGASPYFNAALYFDDNSGATITHNSFYSESHTLYFGDGGAAGTLTNVSLYNNIFYSNLKNSICFPVDAAAKFNACDGNMYYAPAGFVASATVTNMNFAQWQAYLPGAGNEAQGFNANPSFVAPASNNLDLNSGSPAINVVNVASSVSDDIYSTARPNGPKKDVGAYEAIVAPVTLIYFMASCNQENVTVTWVTGNEINNDYFILEKSISPAGEFSEVTRIDGQGKGISTKAKTYQFRDNYNGASYYRIKQVDIDGNFTYTNVTRSNCTSQKVIVINSGDQLEIVCSEASAGEEIQVSIISLKGQELIQTGLSLSSVGSTQISISNLNPAMYILSVKKGTEVFSTKFLKE
jgi:hypothetical protein